MAGLFTPSSSAGVTSFYDAPSKGPKLNPKIILIAIIVFTVVILVADHVLYLA
jgi:preprotein translocase subunit Sec61beta